MQGCFWSGPKCTFGPDPVGLLSKLGYNHESTSKLCLPLLMDFVHMSLQDGVGDECHITASAGVLLLLHHISSSSISLGYLQSPSGHLEEEVREAGDGKTQDDLIFKESAFRADSFYKSKCP